MYKAVLRDSGEEVAVKVQRPGIEPVILRDLFIFRTLGSLFNTLSRQVGVSGAGARGREGQGEDSREQHISTAYLLLGQEAPGRRLSRRWGCGRGCPLCAGCS